ncbi:dioxygenase [Aquabacterium sp.]|uniref:dioxygenase family protein n=1 Tax=Aquabacterium sp. TaxID=1872578 RepID=UPI002B964F93|nr:dioxygenase [Aquabacterium sp.]HSW07437.1 dioxygenase [Aquabacterium sp.]
MAPSTEPQIDELTAAVLRTFEGNADARYKEIMSAVVRHLHALVKEVDLKPEEWMAAIQFITRVGQTCSAQRQECILLSDTLGVSMLVVGLEQARRSKQALADPALREMPTEATVQGPFYWEGSPVLSAGSDIGQGLPGEPAYYSGTVSDTHGQAIANACLDVWSGDGEGVYDMQRGGEVGMRLRARFHTDDQGRYRFWSIKPTYYPIPMDGPVGDMINKMGRHPNRPGHIHAMVYAECYVPVTTHLFPSDSPFLDSDVVFGVRNSLVVPWEKHPPGTAPDGRVMDRAYHTARYDFHLARAA